MAQQGSYPLNGRTLAPNDTLTGVVTGATADVPISTLATLVTTLVGATTPLAIANGGTGANAAAGALTNLLTGSTVPVGNGGTGANAAPGARMNLGAAASGANSDITSLSGLTTALSVAQGGTGATTALNARMNLGAAASGANADITSLSGLTTALSIAQGGTGATTAAGALATLGAAALAGSAAQAFNVAAATVATQAIPLAQAQGLVIGQVQGSFKNLRASATGLSVTVTVTADEISVESSANQYLTLRTIVLAINSAASGANGLDTGALAASTWYSTWVIYNPTTQTTAGLLSLSATAPTLPAGYTYMARTGWIRTDSTASKYPLSFKQYGRRTNYVVAAGSNVPGLPTIASGTAGSITAPTWAPIGVSAFVPVTAFRINLTGSWNSGSGNVIVAPNSSYGVASSTTNAPPFQTGSGTAGNMTFAPFDIMLESLNIYWASSATCAILACGWEDNL